MKRKILVYLFVLATAAFIYLPSPAKALAKDANNGSMKTLTVNVNGQTRYVRVRGRRYRVRYRVYRRHGRRYIRILRVRRA